MSDGVNTIDDFEPDGQPVKSRISTAQQAQEIANRFLRDDMIRAGRRVKVQGAFNGNAQKSHAEMVKAGRGNETNLNWREHKGHVINAWTPYFDLRSEVPVCIDGDLDSGDAAQDQELMRGFAEYFHQMVFGWKGFEDSTQLCDLQMLLHGVGNKVWEDEWNWKSRAVLASNFYVTDETNASFDNGEMAMITSAWTVSQLWRKIKDPKQAKAMGWNVGAVKKAIMASPNTQNSVMLAWKWDRWEQALKNGDVYVSNTQCKKIECCTIFVEELNDECSISQKIIPFAPDGGKSEFLFERNGKYASWEQVICLFPYDMGSDGTYHSIKGMGTEIYASCALLNSVKNSLADLVVTGIKPMWQPDTNAKMDEFKMAKWGNGNFIPKGINPLNVNIGSSLGPALEISREFNQTLSQNTGAYNQADLAAPTVEETAKSAMIRASERSKLTKGAFNRYYRSADSEYRETWRRATNPELKSWHPGAKEALLFQERCYKLCDKLGVPHGTLQEVTNIRANRSLGLGSVAMRIEIANQFMANIDRFDEVGQNEILRMFAATMTSFHAVDAIVPNRTVRDATNDEAVAAQEDNAFAMLGPEAEARVVPGQNHVLHLSVHVPSMQRDRQMCEQGQQDPHECQKRLEGKGPHAHLHLAELQKNPTRQKEFKLFSAQLAELAAFQDHLDQTIAEQDAAAAKQPKPGEVTPEMAKVSGQLQLKAEKQDGDHQLKIQKQQFAEQMAAQKAQFERALKDATTAHELQLKTATHRVDTGIAVAKTSTQIALDRNKSANSVAKQKLKR